MLEVGGAEWAHLITHTAPRPERAAHGQRVQALKRRCTEQCSAGATVAGNCPLSFSPIFILSFVTDNTPFGLSHALARSG